MAVVGESGSAREAVSLITALRPDVAVLDGHLPDRPGIDVCRAVRSVAPSIRGLILTSYHDDEALLAAISAGASGYVLKQIAGTTLVDTIRRVAAGHSLLDPTITSRAELHERASNGPGRFQSLTDQERTTLGHVAEGMTNPEIAAAMSLGRGAVGDNVSSVLTVLGLGRRT